MRNVMSPWEDKLETFTIRGLKYPSKYGVL